MNCKHPGPSKVPCRKPQGHPGPHSWEKSAALTTPTAADPQAEARKHIGELLGSLDDEAFGWLVMTITGMGRPPIWPDGLGGFRDRDTIEKVRTACHAYVAAMS